LVIDNDKAGMNNGGGSDLMAYGTNSSARAGNPQEASVTRARAAELHWNFNLKVMFYENYVPA
jgi:hypothetical protein